jgi:hypothetical protein
MLQAMIQMTLGMILVVVRIALVKKRMGMEMMMRRMKTLILKEWRTIIVWWLTTETTMTTRMMATTMAMRMRMNRAMSTGTAEQNTMSTLILVQMVCSVSF